MLLDCGFSVQESTRRLQRLGVEPESLAAIVVTHEHSDHLGGVARVARRYGLPVWMTRGTHAVWNDVDVPCIEHFDPHTPFAIGDLEMSPYPVPHDAREPAQFVVGNGGTLLRRSIAALRRGARQTCGFFARLRRGTPPG